MSYRPFSKLFITIIAGVLILGSLVACGGKQAAPAEIKVGVIAPITGSIPAVGQSTINAAQLAVNAVNQAGGVQVGDQKMKVTLVIADNKDQAEAAVSAARKLINQDNVAAIIGPQASRNAIPAAAIAESAHVPLISPWSTNPDTTAGKEYVFRIAYIDPFQGRVLARFSIEELGITQAAVLFDEASAYNKGIAEIYRQVFEEAGGQVVAFETYTTGQEDFSSQLAAVKDSGAGLLFLPNYYNEVPLQVKQAKDMGLELAFLGSDSWGGLQPEDLPALDGQYFSTHYAADIQSDVARGFIQNYQQTYGETPDDVAALTFDAFSMLFQAIVGQGKADPESIRNGLRSIGRFEGVTGTMEYRGTGDPVKSAVILQIKDGTFNFYKLASP
ncbi:MAG: ABC transporter substrate-binding protein [Anaerolineae bacterium]